MSPVALTRNPTLRALALAVTLVALIAVLWQSDEPTILTDAAALRGESEPDSFVVDSEYLSFSETGHLDTRIESPRVEQFETDQLITMQQPQATLFGEAGDASWEVQAREGEFLQSRNLMQLTGDVRVVRLAQTGSPMSLFTQALTLDNESRTAYTSEPVEINDALGVTRAIGLKAWIDERILELNSQVEGRYETGQ